MLIDRTRLKTNIPPYLFMNVANVLGFTRSLVDVASLEKLGISMIWTVLVVFVQPNLQDCEVPFSNTDAIPTGFRRVLKFLRVLCEIRGGYAILT